jgi:hypothetical protein
MKSFRWLLMATAAVLFVLSISPREAAAVPAFARQTGMPCSACHFQHFPVLNDFGMAFKMNGYTMIGAQKKVEAKNLSLPVVLNASLVTKIRYQLSNGPSREGTDRGELQFPDEAALLIGGRGGDHVGFLLEMQLPEGDQSAFASFKMPFVYIVKGITLSAIPFTTDSGGAAYGFELLNTGAMRMHRVLEDRKATSAQQYIGTATEAEGLALVAAKPIGFINATVWGPAHGSADTGPRLSHYLRAAVTPHILGWAMGGGVQYWGGKTKIGDTAANPDQIYKTRAWALDAQAQGLVGTMPVGVYVTYGQAAKDKDGPGGETNLFNDGNPKARKAWTILAEVGVLPGRGTVAMGYRGGKNGAASDNTDNAFVIGVTCLLIQNVEFQINHSRYTGDANSKSNDGGDQLTTFMIFAAL